MLYDRSATKVRAALLGSASLNLWLVPEYSNGDVVVAEAVVDVCRLEAVERDPVCSVAEVELEHFISTIEHKVRTSIGGDSSCL